MSYPGGRCEACCIYSLCVSVVWWVLFGEEGEVSGDRAVIGPAGEIDTLKRGL